MKKVLLIGGLLALMYSCRHECRCDVYVTDEELGLRNQFLLSETESGKWTKSECSAMSGTDKDEYGAIYRADCYAE